MRKVRISLFQLIVCLPLTVGLLLAVHTYQKSTIRSRFEIGVERDHLALKMSELTEAFGMKEALHIINTKASKSDKLYTDGESRVVQIVKQRKHGEESYIIALKSLDGDIGGWIGPSGMRVGSVQFSDSEIICAIHGELRWKSSSVFISENSKETFSIPWSKGAKPSHGSLTPKIRMWAIHSGRTIE